MIKLSTLSFILFSLALIACRKQYDIDKNRSILDNETKTSDRSGFGIATNTYLQNLENQFLQNIRIAPSACTRLESYDSTSLSQELRLLLDGITDGACLALPKGAKINVDIASLLKLQQKKDIKIFGQGASLVLKGYDPTRFLKNQGAILTIEESENIHIYDTVFTMDRARDLFGEITNINRSENGKVTVKIDPQFTITPIPGTGKKLYVEHIMQWKNRKIPGKWEIFGKNPDLVVQCRVNCENPSRLIDISFPEIAHTPLKKGEFILIQHGKRQTAGIDLPGSTNIHLENIRFEGIAGAAIKGASVTQFTAKNIYTMPPEKGFSSTNDLLWIRAAKGEWKIDNVYSNYQTDDVINIHPPRAKVRFSGNVDQGSLHPLPGPRISWFVSKGEPLYTFNDELKSLGKVTVEKIESDGTISVVPSGENKLSQNITYLVPVNWFPSSVTLDNIHVRSGRTRILMKTPNTTLTNCSSQDNMMSAVLINDESHFVAEHGQVDGIAISNCSFANVALRTSHHVAALLISGRTEKKVNGINGFIQFPYHGEISIVNTTFRNLPQAAIAATAAKKVILKENSYINVRGKADPENVYNKFFNTPKYGNFQFGSGAVKNLFVTDFINDSELQ